MTHHRPLLALSTLLLGAGAALAQPADLTCMALDVVAAGQPSAARKSFSATRTIDLTVVATFKELPSREHLLELVFTSPDGFLYQSMAFPIAPAGRVAGHRRIPDYPNPVSELRVATETGADGLARNMVTVPFPVAGTTIVSSGLYGRWTVEARLDGARTPCTRGLTFTLTP